MIQRITLIALFFLAFAGSVQAQQDPLYSQYMFNMLGINPAYAGSREILSVSAMARRQWVGVKGAPMSQVLMGDFSVHDKKVGLGVQLFNDEIGIMKTSGLSGSFAYRLRFKKSVLAMGLQGGFTMFKANYAGVDLGGDPDMAFANNVTEFKPTIGAGLFYNTEKFYVGFSAPHLLHYRAYKSSEGQASSIYQNDHWFLTAGYVFDLSPDVALKPSVLLRMVTGAPITADINANMWFYNTVSIGLSYRTSEMMVGMLEFQLNKQLRFGYAYDWTLSELNNKGSHELMLRYEFGFEKKRMVSPRYF